jgi:hypothetical protein
LCCVDNRPCAALPENQGKETQVARDKISILVLFLSFTITAVAQNTKDGGAVAFDTVCAHTYKSGVGFGINETQYCVTDNGNITQFSENVIDEHIATTFPSEGYAICDFTDSVPVAYYDYATYDSGNWQPSTVLSSNANSIKLSRTTSNGIWQITQTITMVKANAKSAGAAKISMVFKNLTPLSRPVHFFRYVDIDADNDFSDDDFIGSYRQVSGQNANGFGLSLISNTVHLPLYGASVLNTGGFGPDPCDPAVSIVPSSVFHGDGSGMLWYKTVVPKGGSKTINMTYQAY